MIYFSKYCLLLFGNKERRVRIIAKREILVDILMGDGINKTHTRLVAFPNDRKAIYAVLNLRSFHIT